MTDEVCSCMVAVDDTGIVSIWSMCDGCITKAVSDAAATPGMRITRLDSCGNIAAEAS